jgi:hypothetical protein
MDEVYSPDNIELSEEAKVAFFLGAGASIPAGLSSVVGLVSEFRNWLQSENKTNQLELTDRIISTIRNWKQDSGDNRSRYGVAIGNNRKN